MKGKLLGKKFIITSFIILLFGAVFYNVCFAADGATTECKPCATKVVTPTAVIPTYQPPIPFSATKNPAVLSNDVVNIASELSGQDPYGWTVAKISQYQSGYQKGTDVAGAWGEKVAGYARDFQRAYESWQNAGSPEAAKINGNNAMIAAKRLTESFNAMANGQTGIYTVGLDSPLAYGGPGSAYFVSFGNFDYLRLRDMPIGNFKLTSLSPDVVAGARAAAKEGMNDATQTPQYRAACAAVYSSLPDTGLKITINRAEWPISRLMTVAQANGQLNAPGSRGYATVEDIIDPQASARGGIYSQQRIDNLKIELQTAKNAGDQAKVQSLTKQIEYEEGFGVVTGHAGLVLYDALRDLTNIKAPTVWGDPVTIGSTTYKFTQSGWLNITTGNMADVAEVQKIEGTLYSKLYNASGAGDASVIGNAQYSTATWELIRLAGEGKYIKEDGTIVEAKNVADAYGKVTEKINDYYATNQNKQKAVTDLQTLSRYVDRMGSFEFGQTNVEKILTILDNFQNGYQIVDGKKIAYTGENAKADLKKLNITNNKTIENIETSIKTIEAANAKFSSLPSAAKTQPVVKYESATSAAQLEFQVGKEVEINGQRGILNKSIDLVSGETIYYVGDCPTCVGKSTKNPSDVKIPIDENSIRADKKGNTYKWDVGKDTWVNTQDPNQTATFAWITKNTEPTTTPPTVFTEISRPITGQQPATPVTITIVPEFKPSLPTASTWTDASSVMKVGQNQVNQAVTNGNPVATFKAGLETIGNIWRQTGTNLTNLSNISSPGQRVGAVIDAIIAAPVTTVVTAIATPIATIGSGLTAVGKWIGGFFGRR